MQFLWKAQLSHISHILTWYHQWFYLCNRCLWLFHFCQLSVSLNGSVMSLFPAVAADRVQHFQSEPFPWQSYCLRSAIDFFWQRSHTDSLWFPLGTPSCCQSVLGYLAASDAPRPTPPKAVPSLCSLCVSPKNISERVEYWSSYVSYQSSFVQTGYHNVISKGSVRLG